MFFFDEEKEQRRRGAPPIGTTLYVVREHLYYEKGRAAPMLEYVVCRGTLRRLIIGKWTDMELVLENAGANNLAYPKTSDIGKKVFYTAREAAMLAQAMTEDHERRWSRFDPPMRRPWAELLE